MEATGKIVSKIRVIFGENQLGLEAGGAWAKPCHWTELNC